jgi:hypothetical protein
MDNVYDIEKMISGLRQMAKEQEYVDDGDIAFIKSTAIEGAKASRHDELRQLAEAWYSQASGLRLLNGSYVNVESMEVMWNGPHTRLDLHIRSGVKDAGESRENEEDVTLYTIKDEKGLRVLPPDEARGLPSIREWIVEEYRIVREDPFNLFTRACPHIVIDHLGEYHTVDLFIEAPSDEHITGEKQDFLMVDAGPNTTRYTYEGTDTELDGEETYLMRGDDDRLYRLTVKDAKMTIARIQE